MEAGIDRDVAPRLERAVHLGDPGVRPDEVPHRVPAEGHDQDRLDLGDLALKIRAARRDLVRHGVAVAGRAVLDDVRDEDVLAFEPGLAEHLVQQVAGRADERSALGVFVEAGALADEQHVGLRVPLAGTPLRVPWCRRQSVQERTSSAITFSVCDTGPPVELCLDAITRGYPHELTRPSHPRILSAAPLA